MSRFMFTILLTVLLLSCSTDSIEIQIIDINHYDDKSQNVKLSEDLLYYDIRYIIANVPALNEQSAASIKISHFVTSSDGKPSYRISYSHKNSEVSSNIKELKQGFKTFIPKLASEHALKTETINRLIPIGKNWVELIFKGEGEQIHLDISNLIKSQLNAQYFRDLANNLEKDFGKNPSTTFIRAQYYKKFSDAPELMSLHYLVEFEKTRATFSITTHEIDGKWHLLGYKVVPI